MDALLQYEGDMEKLDAEMAYTDPNNNDDFETSASSTAGVKEDKYLLRPRSVRRVTETLLKLETTQCKNSKTGKQKPAPLSKYRRKTANARERNRMREINQAFETLRQVIPQMASSQPTTSANEKLTKITTLRLAMKYISSLSAALNAPEGLGYVEPTFSDCSDLDCLLLESDGESLPLSDHSSLLASPDFPDSSLSPVDFNDPTFEFSQHSVFSDFLLT